MRNIFHLIRLTPGYRGRFARVVAVNVLLGVGAVVAPYLFKQIVDSVAVLANNHADIGTARATVITALLILAGLRFATIVLNYFQERASDMLYLEVMWGLRRQLFHHLTRLSIDYYEQHRVGEIVQKINNATMQLRMLLEQWAEGSLLSILTLIFIVGVLLIQLPPVGLLLLVMIPTMLSTAIYACP